MSIQRSKCLLLAGLALLSAGAAQAADYAPPPPPPMIMQQPVEEFASNWYLRGFVGVGITGKSDLTVTPLPADSFFASHSIADSVFLGGGVGYNFNSWLRFDVTAEYRFKTRVSALGVVQPGGAGPVAVDQFDGHLSSLIVLANGFIDLGTWDCWTPFVGAGIGFANNTISDFVDVTPNVAAFGATGSSFGLGRGTSNWDAAWALYAGLSWAVSKNFNVDFTFRHLNFGTAKETVDCNGSSNCNHFEFKNLHSEDIMLGLRWTCCETAPVAPAVYAPPPLRSRG